MPNPQNLIGKGFDVNPQNIGKKKTGDVSPATRLKKVIRELMAAGDIHAIDKIYRTMIKKATWEHVLFADVAAGKLILEVFYGKQFVPKEEQKPIDNNIKNEIIAFLYKEVAPEKVTELLEHLDKKYPDDK